MNFARAIRIPFTTYEFILKSSDFLRFCVAVFLFYLFLIRWSSETNIPLPENIRDYFLIFFYYLNTLYSMFLVDFFYAYAISLLLFPTFFQPFFPLPGWYFWVFFISSTLYSFQRAASFISSPPTAYTDDKGQIHQYKRLLAGLPRTSQNICRFMWTLIIMVYAPINHFSKYLENTTKINEVSGGSIRFLIRNIKTTLLGFFGIGILFFIHDFTIILKSRASMKYKRNILWFLFYLFLAFFISIILFVITILFGLQ